MFFYYRYSEHRVKASEGIMMKSILSIQSAVSIGAVGNTMAALVLSARGHHISRLDTVQLAAHPGYGFRAGGSIDSADFAAILRGIERLAASIPEPFFSAVVTGYIGDEGQIVPLRDFLGGFIAGNPETPVIIDPAIGDHGRLYVAPAIAEGIREALLPLAEIITPNSFELGWLTGCSVDSRGNAADAARVLLGQHKRLKAVVLTGLEENKTVSDAVITREGFRFFEKQHTGTNFPRASFPGGGDMFTAILTSALISGGDLTAAVDEASRLSHAILEESRKQGSSEILLAAVRAHLCR